MIDDGQRKTSWKLEPKDMENNGTVSHFQGTELGPNPGVSEPWPTGQTLPVT